MNTEEDEVSFLTREDWQAESVVIREYAAFDRSEIMNLYTSVGWTNYTDHPQMLEKAYKNSLCTLGAYTADGRLAGIIRAVGDGASILFIQDIIVLPEFQRRGIGTMLMQAILERYAFGSVKDYAIMLFYNFSNVCCEVFPCYIV